mmetsp:Transcript_25927/g.40587  ORF Transcript_25927/g.40587 Transcript_25927/m.40587 type:complete len:268 (-) Transcript_25927:1200-2003(-)
MSKMVDQKVQGWLKTNQRGSRPSGMRTESQSHNPLEDWHSGMLNWGKQIVSEVETSGKSLVSEVETSFSAIGDMIAGSHQDPDALSSGTTPRIQHSARSSNCSDGSARKAAFTADGTKFIGRNPSERSHNQSSQESGERILSARRKKGTKAPQGLKVPTQKERFEEMLKQSRDQGAEKHLCKRLYEAGMRQKNVDDDVANEQGRLYTIKHKAYGQPKNHNKLSETTAHTSTCTCPQCHHKHNEVFKKMVLKNREKELLESMRTGKGF